MYAIFVRADILRRFRTLIAAPNCVNFAASVKQSECRERALTGQTKGLIQLKSFALVFRTINYKYTNMHINKCVFMCVCVCAAHCTWRCCSKVQCPAVIITGRAYAGTKLM